MNVTPHLSRIEQEQQRRESERAVVYFENHRKRCAARGESREALPRSQQNQVSEPVNRRNVWRQVNR